ncbi:MAG: T9SS type A sorting domain-containing protein, partial [Caldanaerobacter sp.]
LDFLHLSSSSEMVDAGVIDDSIFYNGNAPDIGAFETSDTSTGSITISRNKSETAFNAKLLENPFSSELKLQILDIDLDIKSLRVIVTSVTGRTIDTKIVNVSSSNDLITLNAEGWEAGIYLLSLFAKQSVLSFKCVKK